MTLGIFLLVINGAMLGLVAAMLDGFRVSGLFPAILGSLVVSFISWAVSR
ncbi:MAG: phage holin family protein [Deltaproteobacteria bacterium]|nr:phage holin family protein [Deltaproteobacteria bacterium]